MGMRLSEAAKLRAKVEVDFPGTTDKLTVWHNPSVYTAVFEANLRQEMEDTEVQGNILCGMLDKMLLEWDLVDDEGFILGEDGKGNVVPITIDNLRKVPMSILTAVSQACQASHQPSDPNDAAPRRSGSFS